MGRIGFATWGREEKGKEERIFQGLRL